MKIFDQLIKQTYEFCRKAGMKKMESGGRNWEIQEKNTFLMERDTALELGGYPKESINIIVPTTELEEIVPLEEGIYCIGDPAQIAPGSTGHISFGKVVFIETEEISDKEIYSFTQEELLTDTRIRMKDIMLRQSPVHYNINLRIGKKAAAAGFDTAIMGDTIWQAFRHMQHVRRVIVILLLGDSPLYRELLPLAERMKEVTLTLNHIFDGINMDCGRCDVREICNEIEGMRELHKRNDTGGRG